MPLPTPNQGEARQAFLDRCMGNPTMNSEYPDSSQRYAVCNSQWRRRKKELMGKETMKLMEEKHLSDVDIFSRLIDFLIDENLDSKFIESLKNE